MKRKGQYERFLCWIFWLFEDMGKKGEVHKELNKVRGENPYIKGKGV